MCIYTYAQTCADLRIPALGQCQAKLFPHGSFGTCAWLRQPFSPISYMLKSPQLGSGSHSTHFGSPLVLKIRAKRLNTSFFGVSWISSRRRCLTLWRVAVWGESLVYYGKCVVGIPSHRNCVSIWIKALQILGCWVVHKAHTIDSSISIRIWLQ